MLAVFLLMAAVGWSGPAPDPALPGPFGVGVETVEHVDTARGGRKLVTEIWYPSTDKSEPWTYPSGARSTAKRDAPIAEGRFPLVLFSHGNFAVREQTTFLTEHLASHGYVVAAPDHQFNTRRDYVVAETVPSGEHRPKDLSFLIDQLEAGSARANDRFFGKLDLDRIAATGTSYGGYTALAVAGARVNDLRKQRDESQPLDMIDLGDPRVDCAIAYVPLVRPALSAEGLAKLTRPVLIFCGTLDSLTPHRVHQLPLLRELGGTSYLATMEGATHFNFENEETITGAKRWAHRPTIERADADRIIRQVSVAFLERYLTTRDTYASFLSPRSDPPLTLEIRGVDGARGPAAP